MSDIQLLKDLFGQELAESVGKHEMRSWDIRNALNTEYTPRERNQRTRNSRVAISNEFQVVVDNAKLNRSISTDREAINKLLRFGLQEFLFLWGEKIQVLSELETAGTITSNYLRDDDFTQNSLHQTELLPELECTGSKQVRIYEVYHNIVASMSEKSGISLSKVFHLGVLLAGKGMCDENIIPAPRCESITSKIEKIDNRFQQRKTRQYQIVNGAITRALKTDYQTEIENKLESNCPRVWAKYEKDLGEVTSQNDSIRLWD